MGPLAIALTGPEDSKRIPNHSEKVIAPTQQEKKNGPM